jgi:HAD superfamily hydrolase (TIGR01509 family)
MTTIQAVIFDLDGLLVDSEPLQAWAWHEYARRFGAVLTPDVLRQMLGLRGVDAAPIFVALLDLPVSGEIALRERDAIFLAAVPGALQAHHGAHELIAELHRRGIPLALATSGHRRYVDLALASAGLTGAFDVEVTAEHVARGKPHPDVYLRAAGARVSPPAPSHPHEDAPNGVAAAKAAGMLCFAIQPDAEHAHGLSRADAVLVALGDVMAEVAARGYALPPPTTRRPKGRRSSRR